jgi:membrane fusion protein, multidrug efflux system
MLRRIIYMFLVLLVLGGLGGLIAYYAFDIKPNMIAQVIGSAPKPVETVSAEDARQDSWEPHVAAIGTLMAVNGIEVAPQVGGVVKELLFDSGQVVKKGDKLVQLDTDTDEADLRNMKAQLTNAEEELARREKTFKAGYTAKADLQTAQMLRNQLKANVDRVEALIAQKSVYAPWDGKVGLRDIAVGKYVAPGQTIVWLQTVNPIYADFTITEVEYGIVKIGQKVTAKFSAYPDQIFNGEVMTTDARMSAQSRTITVRAKIDNADGRLVPGMYADVTVTVGQPEAVTTVSQSAVTYSLYGDSVFAVVKPKEPDPNSKEEVFEIERRFVKLGSTRDGRVQILDGVRAGEKVVVAGQNKIDQGTKVKIDNSIALNLDVDRMTQ